VTGWLGDNTWAVGLLVGAYVAWKVITIIMTATTWLATAAQWALNAAMYANPIGLVVLAIIALIAIIILIVKYFDEFVEVVKLVGKLLLVLIFGPFALLILFFDEIVTAVVWMGKKIWEVIDSVIGFFGDLLEAVYNFVVDIKDYFVGLASDALGWGLDLVKNIGQGIVDGTVWVLEKIGEFVISVGSKIGELVSDAFWWGVDMVGNFVGGIWSGIKSAGSAVADGFLALVGKGWIWDIRANDLMGIGWGEDMVKFVALGIDQGVSKNKNKLSMPVEMISPKLTGGLSAGNQTSNSRTQTTNDQYRITVNIEGSELENQNYLDVIKKQTREQTRRQGDSKRWYDEQ